MVRRQFSPSPPVLTVDRVSLIVGKDPYRRTANSSNLDTTGSTTGDRRPPRTRVYNTDLEFLNHVFFSYIV